MIKVFSMPKRFFFSLISFFLYNSTFSQSLSLKEISDLHSAIGIFLLDQEKEDDRKRPSEFIICFLDVDNDGKVSGIHFLADDKNKDSTYAYLLRMKPTLFSDLKFEKCKRKTIMFPIISSGQGKGPVYIEGLKELHQIKRVIVESESSKLVKISPLLYRTPFIESEPSEDIPKRL